MMAKKSSIFSFVIVLVCAISIAFYLKLSPSIPPDEVVGISLLRKKGGFSYFVNENGDAVYLSGSDNSMKDIGYDYPPESGKFEAKLNMIEENGHNFMRLWTWELTKYKYSSFPDYRYVEPFPWQRTTGSGVALDGRGKFDLTKFNQSYFDKLRSRVVQAGEKGIYVSIMLFEGHGPQFSERPWCWDGHPFNFRNNVNNVGRGIDESDGRGTEIHTLADPSVTSVQEAYVRKVIDTVNDLDNVLYEIANEAGVYSTEWQYHMIEYIKDYERTKPKQHPVGMSWQWRGGTNVELFNSPADWISPIGSAYRSNPPVPDGRKVIIPDTDHLWGGTYVREGVELNRAWVWKSFCRGLNPALLDYSQDELIDVRANMGYTVSYSKRIDLNNAIFSLTKYSITNEGEEYLVYLPTGGSHTVDLSHASGNLRVEWFNPDNGKKVSGGTVSGGGSKSFTPPFSGDAVLFIWKE